MMTRAPQIKTMFRSRFFERVDEPQSRSALQQKGNAAVAGEGEVVSVARKVVLLDLLAKFGRPFHDTSPNASNAQTMLHHIVWHGLLLSIVLPATLRPALLASKQSHAFSIRATCRQGMK